jgi:hypothetical protein
MTKGNVRGRYSLGDVCASHFRYPESEAASWPAREFGLWEIMKTLSPLSALGGLVKSSFGTSSTVRGTCYCFGQMATRRV